MSEYFTSSDGLRIAYRVIGSGPLLVCQPGGPGRASRYLGDLGGLSEHRTLVIVDARGTGESEAPTDDVRRSFPHLSADLESLREHLAVEQLDLLGHSAGAVVALHYAATHPDRVSRLVLITPSGRLLGSAYSDLREIEQRYADQPWYADACAARAQYDQPHTPEEQHELDLAMRPFLYGRWTEVEQAHAAGADTEMDAAAERGFAPQPGEVDDDAVRASLAQLAAPVLVVAGERDACTGVEAARQIAEHVPNGELVVLRRLGHFPWVEDPVLFAGTVSRWLAGSLALSGRGGD
jgi:pimeloyl-ACP methyl ester carboxylesterase